MKKLIAICLACVGLLVMAPGTKTAAVKLQGVLEFIFAKQIEADNAKKTEEWLKEKMQYESAGNNAACN